MKQWRVIGKRAPAAEPRRLATTLFTLLCLIAAFACGPVPSTSYPGAEPSSDGDLSSFPPPEDEPPPVNAAAWGNLAAPPGSTVVIAPPGSAVVIYTDPGDIPHLEIAGEAKKLPLDHTHVRASLRGFVAEVEVTQTYQNPSDKPIEAVYIFPLPENSAVYSMRMVIGERVIEADVRRREEARQIYEKAKRTGHTAALLEQERPNIFTQSVANIEPGKKIDVVTRYVQDLTYDAGRYEFVFPMVVGPRFIGGEPLNAKQAGAGTYGDTTLVPDASRISPPMMGQGERTGHDISLEVTVDAGAVIGDIDVPTHEIVAQRPTEGALHVKLAERRSLPNRDFVLRYRAAGDKPRARLLLSEAGASGGYFSLVLHPPRLDIEELVGQREVIFVVDVSGSMSGLPLELCKEAMRDAIVKLRPVDTFNIITFAGSTGRAFPAPRPANSATIREAFDFVGSMVAGGGTHMADAVTAALRPEVAPGRHRYVVFLTDGYVGGEAEIFSGARSLVAGLEAKGQRARVFGVGIGSSVNRHLIEGLSRSGKGVATYAGTREDPARAVNKVYHYIDRAVLTDVRPDFADAEASEIFPAAIPDLFASHPVILHGRYKKAPTGRVVVRGKVGGNTIEIPVEVRRDAGTSTGVLGQLWARAKIASLEEELWTGPSPGAERAITDLGLDFHLVTRFTSLIAVDWSRKTGDGNPETIVQPASAPEGVEPEMAGARMVGGSVTRSFESLSGDSYSAQEIVVVGRAPTIDTSSSTTGVLIQTSRNLQYTYGRGNGCACRAGLEREAARGGEAAVLLAIAAIAARRVRRRRPGL
jgi:Ca-activated chloride channel family protein